MPPPHGLGVTRVEIKLWAFLMVEQGRVLLPGSTPVHLGGDCPAEHTSVGSHRRAGAAEVACRPVSQVPVGSCGHRRPPVLSRYSHWGAKLPAPLGEV